jgi:hypothetical protein
MPIVITFDISGALPGEHNRIQSFFTRLGWENLGGSSYRYPKLGTAEPVEDWFNHVIPALMLFRSYVRSSGRELTKFTIDAQSSSGFSSEGNFGSPPLPASEVQMYSPGHPGFGEDNLRNWLDGVTYPY